MTHTTLTKFLFLSVLASAVSGCAMFGSVAKTTDVLAGTNLAEQGAAQTHSAGRNAAAEVMRRYPPIADDSATTYVNRVGQYLALHLSPQDKITKCADGKVKTAPAKGFRVAIIANAEQNAFTVPGGFIFLTTGLVGKLKSEDQLAGVIAHEIMHSLCGDDAPDDMTQLVTDLSGYLDGIMAKPYTKAQLSSADRAAIVALYRAGYYPNHYVRYVFENESGVTGKRTSGKERTAMMQKDITKLAAKIDKTVDARRSRYEAFQRGVMSAAANLTSSL